MKIPSLDSLKESMDILTARYHQAEDYLFKSLACTSLKIGDEIRAYKTQVPIADLNPVVMGRLVENLEGSSKDIEQFYQQDHTPYLMLISQPCCTAKARMLLEVRGYQQTDVSVAMAMSFEKMALDVSRGVDSHMVVEHHGDLRDWQIPLAAFGASLEITKAYVKRHEAALKSQTNLRHFSLYDQGKPVASLTLSMHRTLARIDDVGTLSAYQRRGLATHLIGYVLVEAQRAGGQCCFPEASNSGVGLYQRARFSTLFKSNIFLKRVT